MLSLLISLLKESLEETFGPPGKKQANGIKIEEIAVSFSDVNGNSKGEMIKVIDTG